MADPQNTLGDLLGKLGVSLGDSESQRQDMIRRLKTVKDPEERDRIIWALSGQRKEEAGRRPPARYGKSSKAALGKLLQAERQPFQTGAPQRSPTPPPGTIALPEMRVGNIFSYVVPILFLFFGISNIVRAIEAFQTGAGKEEVFVQALIGLGFIVFAVAGFFSRKMKKTAAKGV